MKQKLLISSCLIGNNVKYNGKNNQIDLTSLEKKYTLIPFCPEVEGGLPTPRPPSEIVSQNPLKLINNQGKDVTKFFVDGAEKCLDLAKKERIKKALLKANSPSCSNSFVYDGTFSGKLVKELGVTAKLLKDEGITVYNENEIGKL